MDRALDRLRERLIKQGISTTAVALGGALTAHAIESVPAGLSTLLIAGSTAAAAPVAAGGSFGWLSHVMLMTKTKIALTIVLVAAGLATPLLLQQQALAKARAEQVELRQRERSLTARAATPAAAMIRPEADARRDREDLDRLRRDAADLRALLSQLGAQEQKLDAQLATAGKSGERGSGAKQINLAAARNVGHASQDGLVETFIWALSNGDTNLVQQLIASDTQPDVERLVQPAFAQLKQQLVSTVSSYGCTGFLVQPDAPVETGPYADRWLLVDLMNTNGAVGQPTKFRVRQTADGWKLVLMADGMPVTEAPQP